MWYFTWMLGVGFAVLLAILNAMWGEHATVRQESLSPDALTPEMPDHPHGSLS